MRVEVKEEQNSNRKDRTMSKHTSEWTINQTDEDSLLSIDPSSDELRALKAGVDINLTDHVVDVVQEYTCQENSMSEYRFAGREHRLYISPLVPVDDLNEYLAGDECCGLLDRLSREYTEYRDGNNYVGELTEEGQAILRQIQTDLDRLPIPDEGGVIDACEWFAGNYPEELTASSTDAEIEAMAEDVMRWAATDNYIMDRDDVIRDLKSTRDSMIED
jgi:hypothetical protein